MYRKLQKNSTPYPTRKVSRGRPTATSTLSEVARISFQNRQKAAELARATPTPKINEIIPESPSPGGRPETTVQFSGPDSTIDQIALTSALRLQIIQRERAKRDIMLLREMREKAMADPIGFMQHFVKSPATHSRESNIVDFAAVSSTSMMDRGIQGLSSHATSRNAKDYNSNIDDDPDGEYEEEFPFEDTPAAIPVTAENSITTGGSKFGEQAIPEAQSIYPCPNINWAKYRVLEAPLDEIYSTERQSDLRWASHMRIFDIDREHEP